MQIRNTTKMAFQAAMAISIAEVINGYFQMERGYWIILTAMALTTQAWGESIKRSIERVSMTILGGLCGTGLYFLLPANDTLILVLLLTFVFFTVYILPINHLLGVFTLTGFVVFLFALLGDWTLFLLRERILDTVLGALIAIFVGCIFLPVRTNIIDVFIGYLEKMNAALALTFTTQQQSSPVISNQNLYADFQTIRKQAIAIRYEVLFHRLSRQEFNSLLMHMAFSTQYVAGLTEAYRWLVCYLTNEDKAHLETAVKTTQHNLAVLIKHLKRQKHPSMLPVINLTDLLTKAISTDAQRFASLESEALGFYSLMYFFTRLNAQLNESYRLLSHVYD